MKRKTFNDIIKERKSISDKVIEIVENRLSEIFQENKKIIRKFVIPVGGITKEKANAALKVMISNYKEDI